MAEARHVDKDFVECEVARRATEGLAAQAPSFQSKKDMLDACVLAQGLADVDSAMASADIRAREFETEYAKTTAKRLAASQTHQDAVTRLTREQARTEERQTLESRSGQLKQWRNSLEAAGCMRSARDAADAMLSTATSILEKATSRCEASRARKGRSAQSLASGQQTLQQFGFLTARQRTLAGELEKAKRFVVARDALAEAQRTHAKAKTDCDNTDAKRAQAQTAYDGLLRI